MYDVSFLWIALFAILIDYIIGELPIRHPVQFMGDFVQFYEKYFYKNTVTRGIILVVLLIIIVGSISIFIQYKLLLMFNKNIIPDYLYIGVISVIASMGLASKSLKQHVINVLKAPNENKRAALSMLVTRNTNDFDEDKIYSTLVETHSENLSDGFIAPLFYLLIFGLPGIMIFKAVSTMDSMVGYKNERYINFGKAAAILDDILNLIPARITGLLIWLLSSNKVSWDKWFDDAEKYSSSPNAGYPVAAAAYAVGIKVGGPVQYGNTTINKAEIGIERTLDYGKAVKDFIRIHSIIEFIIFIFLLAFIAFIVFS